MSSLPEDTRGIIDPARMARHAVLHRYPPGAALDGIVDWFWAVTWRVPDGVELPQRVLNHPSGHISAGTSDDLGATRQRPGARVYGLVTRVSTRRLAGTGWTVAAKTTTGGLGALLDRPARLLTDKVTSLDDAFGLDGSAVLASVVSTPDESDRVEVLREALAGVAGRRDPQRLAQARQVAEAARIAEFDRDMLRVEQLAAAAGVGVRTLQRLFDEYVGIGPAWVIRRWRLIEAAQRAVAERAVGGQARPWAELAADLGYADHAHLTRDFRNHLGVSPSEYLANQAH